MKKKDIVEGLVEYSEFPNVGVVCTGDGNVRVKNALDGQTVRVQIQKARKGKFEGRLLEVLEPSAMETETDYCKHFNTCGGCLYGTISYENEIKIKESQAKRVLSPVIGEDVFNKVYKGIEKSPISLAYRNKMEYSFGDEYKGGPLALGMHKRGAFYDIVTVDDCRITDADFVCILKTTLDFFTSRNIKHYNKNTEEGYLRHLLVRKAENTEEILVCLVTKSGIDASLVSEWKDVILGLTHSDKLTGKITGILHTQNDRIADVVENQGTKVLYGEDFFTEKLLGLSFKITPFSFFQTNSLGAEVLYSTVRSLMENTDTVYDLYCGTGTISQIVSGFAKRVVGVEIVEEAVIAARENELLNHVENVEFISGDVLKVLDDIKVLPDMIILDPPREGVNPKALKKILNYGVENIIYISCKPKSLARDLEGFLEAGYSPQYIKFVDMFPRTGNLETIVLLSREKVDGHIEIDLDVENLEGKSGTATYAEIKKYVADHNDGMKVSSLCIGQIKNKMGLEKRKDYNPFIVGVLLCTLLWKRVMLSLLFPVTMWYFSPYIMESKRWMH